MKSSETKTKSSRLVEARAKGTRELILKAGLDSIIGGGIGGFTANELMRRTGLSKGALFHHFDSLDDVAVECVRHVGNLLHVEPKSTLRESLEFMMSSPHALKRMRAFNVLLIFYCEKGRDEPRFRKTVHQVNGQRQDNVAQLLRQFTPEEKAANVVVATQYLHVSQMGLAGAAGDCLSNPERLRAWEQVVNHTLRILEL